MAISIKEPCHEDWTKMTPTQKGAFCQACAMEVIDFTDKTSFEIKTILAIEFAGSKQTCGRVTNFQLNQINDDFFKWKNETEAFRSVWIFSLIAVFGMTLFSCSNTHTKEMVNQLNIDTTEMLATTDSTTVELTETNADSLVLTPPVLSFNDSLLLANNGPWETPYVHGGTFPNNFRIAFDSNDWNQCGVTLTYTILLGDFYIEPVEEEKVKAFLARPSNFPVASPEILPLPTTIPTPRQPNSPVTQSLEGVLNSSDKQFDAFIYPNPIDIESRLYLEVHEYLELDIDIHEKGKEVILVKGNSTFPVGKHALDLKFVGFAKGEYQLKLEGNKQVSVLEFIL